MTNQWYDIESWQWTGDDSRQWGFSTTVSGAVGYAGLYQIFTDDAYVYVATTSGLEIISTYTEQRESLVTFPYGFTTVWADDERVFLGTGGYGIKTINKSDIGQRELFWTLLDYVLDPFISSNNIRYLHGNQTKLICCTDIGIDIIRRDTHYVTHTEISGAQKCFVTPTNDYYYYTVSGTEYWSINRLNGNTSDWSLPDTYYTTGSGFLGDVTCLVDFYVTEHTATSGINNTLFLATDNGVYVYDEGANLYNIYTTSSGV